MTHLTPADITESFTFGDIEKHFNILIPTMAQGFELPDGINTTAFRIKDMETIFSEREVEIELESVRLFVALYTKSNYDTDQIIYLPQSAANILITQHILLFSQIQLDLLQKSLEFEIVE